MKFRVGIEPDENGVFVASVPSLPGCHSRGQTRSEAMANIRVIACIVGGRSISPGGRGTGPRPLSTPTSLRQETCGRRPTVHRCRG